jgi:hypothetical protein
MEREASTLLAVAGLALPPLSWIEATAVTS